MGNECTLIIKSYRIVSAEDFLALPQWLWLLAGIVRLCIEGWSAESLCAHVATAAYVAAWCWGTERTSSAFHLYITEWGQHANVCCHLLASVIQPYLARCFLWVSSLLNCSVAIGKLKCVASWISLAFFTIREGMNIFLNRV